MLGTFDYVDVLLTLFRSTLLAIPGIKLFQAVLAMG
jgi:hypothetical protein